MIKFGRAETESMRLRVTRVSAPNLNKMIDAGRGEKVKYLVRFAATVVESDER